MKHEQNTSIFMRFCPSVGSISHTDSHMSHFGQLWSSVMLKDCFIGMDWTLSSHL